MELNELRSIATVLMFGLFVGIVFWAWGRHRRTEFDDAAQLPFVDDLPAHNRRGEQA